MFPEQQKRSTAEKFIMYRHPQEQINHQKNINGASGPFNKQELAHAEP